MTDTVQPKSQRLWDIAERVIWTALQVGLAEALIIALEMPQKWILVFTPLLALVKTLLASKFGQTSAATLPATLDAAAPGDKGHPAPESPAETQET
jgi:hypothetical protein